MGRKRKATELKPSTSDASAQSTTSSVVIDNHDEVDWSTIDQRGGFDGFTLKAVKLRPRKESAKLAHKKQKTSTTSSRRSSSYRDAPLDADVSQENPYPETDLSEIYCKIEPVREWESTQRYRKFTSEGPIPTICRPLGAFVKPMLIRVSKSRAKNSKSTSLYSSRKKPKTTTRQTQSSIGLPRSLKCELEMHSTCTCAYIGPTDRKIFQEVVSLITANVS